MHLSPVVEPLCMSVCWLLSPRQARLVPSKHHRVVLFGEGGGFQQEVLGQFTGQNQNRGEGRGRRGRDGAFTFVTSSPDEPLTF